jgi:hypothetical protein
MRFLLSLTLLAALAAPAAPASAQDGPHDAAIAKDAALALAAYADGIARSGGRPNYTTPPASELFGKIFDTGKLAALPPPQAGDMQWMLVWGEAANRTNRVLLLFGSKAGADIDKDALQRNLAEYQDQYAVAMNFLLRFAAREVTAADLFMGALPPDQRTPVRQAGLQQARTGAAETIAGAIMSIAGAMRADNAHLVSAALRDTGAVWAKDLIPENRVQIVAMLSRVPAGVGDAEVHKNLADFATELAAAK